MYNEIKQNIIKNFFNKGYLYACGCKREAIIDNIIDKSIFAINYNYKNDILTMNLGNNISIDFSFNWEYKTYKNNFGREMPHYKLISIK